MIGGVAIGRALTDDTITKSLLDSCRNTAINLLKIQVPTLEKLAT